MRMHDENFYGKVNIEFPQILNKIELPDSSTRPIKVTTKKEPNIKSCYYCEREFDENLTKTRDHIIPLCKGGVNAQINLVYCCSECNGFKGGLMPEDFLDQVRTSIKRHKGYKTASVYTLRTIARKTRLLIDSRVKIYKHKLYKKIDEYYNEDPNIDFYELLRINTERVKNEKQNKETNPELSVATEAK